MSSLPAEALAPQQAPKARPRATLVYLDRPRAYPFLKWAGGKRAIVQDILEELPAQFNDYWEPFLGGGAVFFALDSRIRKAYLSDFNSDLMLTYKTLQENSHKIIKQLKIYKKRHNSQFYKKIREQGHSEQDPVKLAARFIYLNKTCYNGLYRVNKAGKFNVPEGRYINPKICDENNLLAVSEVLAKAELQFQSFEKTNPEKNDLVYCDPPYDDTFASYTDTGFNAQAQQKLKEHCDAWRKKGAFVIVSNSDTSLIRNLWEGYRIKEICAPRKINCKGKERANTNELLIIGGES